MVVEGRVGALRKRAPRLTLCLAPVFRAGLGELEYSASLALSEEYRVLHNFETQFQHKISAYHSI